MVFSLERIFRLDAVQLELLLPAPFQAAPAAATAATAAAATGVMVHFPFKGPPKARRYRKPQIYQHQPNGIWARLGRFLIFPQSARLLAIAVSRN